MSQTTDELIDRLVAEAVPVRRLHPPTARALMWLLVAAALFALVIAWLADMGEFMRRAESPRQVIELAATLLTGILAVVAAFQLSMPDRSQAWILLPLPTLAVWLATSGFGCLVNWINGIGWDFGESTECFLIIVAASVPLGVTVLVMLYRARPLTPNRVALVAGLGISALAAFVLQFFHPFDVTVMDFAFHAAAIALVIGVSALTARRSAAGI